MSPYTEAAIVALIALAGPASAHSWVEAAYRIAPNGTMVGDVGYPRGWVARTSTNPIWKDAIPQWLLPISGQSAYAGDEVLNKYPFEANPKFPMLQASAGDHIALQHLENGHTTLPQNQPMKPHNRGTIYFYGTTEPKAEEKLFDVHLVWNREGTGGDKRGKLLATRNYDDGQCYQPNDGALSVQRANELADDGAVHSTELRCQSDIKLPDDLKEGSVYTIYWYWDWPDLNPDRINMEGTKNGIFPWAGTFMRGEKDPHGFTMDAIARNESYASTVDVKIVGKAGGPVPGAMAKAAAAGPVKEEAWIPDQDIYRKAIKEQMASNFQVDIDANQPANGAPDSPNTPGASQSVPAGVPTGTQGNGGGAVTVTQTVTIPPTTIVSTVYVTQPGDKAPFKSSATQSTAADPRKPSTTQKEAVPEQPTTQLSAPDPRKPTTTQPGAVPAQPTTQPSAPDPRKPATTQPEEEPTKSTAVEPVQTDPTEVCTADPEETTPAKSTTSAADLEKSLPARPVETVVESSTRFVTVTAQPAAPAASGNTLPSLQSGVRPSVTPIARAARRDWGFGL